MQKNDIVTIKIDSYGDNGEGVGRVDGFAVFVPFTIIDEVVEAKIIMLKKSFAIGKLVKIIEKSEDRIEPKCPVFTKCGGCQLQHMNDKAQEEYKRNVVESKIKRLAKIDFPVSKVVFGENKIRYRNKLQLPLSQGNNGLIGGFYAPFSHRIVEIEDCLLQDERSMKVFDALKKYADENGVFGYVEESKKGILRHLVIRSNENGLLITIVIASDKLPFSDKLIAKLDGMNVNYGLYVNVNKKDTNVIFGEKFIHIHGFKELEYNEDGLKYKITPQSFLQVNDEIKEEIYNAAITQNSLTKNDAVINAYSGAGLLTARFAMAAKIAIGVEIVKEATLSADKLALDNNIVNMINITGDCALEIPKVIANIKNNTLDNYYPNNTTKKDYKETEISQNSNSFERIERDNFATSTDDYIATNASESCDNDKLSVANINAANRNCKNSNVAAAKNSNIESERTNIEEKISEFCDTNTSNLIVTLDPPRKGVDGSVLEAIMASNPPRIVYISCNPATLSRDLSLLSTAYYPTLIAPYDMFPQTSHVETVVLLSHKKPDGHINVKVEFGEGEGKVPLDNIAKRAESYKPKERVTYKMIKEYIEAKYGFKVHTAYIAEVKRDLGLPMYDAPNAVEELKQPRKHPTAEKVEAIKDALKHFEVI